MPTGMQYSIANSSSDSSYLAPLVLAQYPGMQSQLQSGYSSLVNAILPGYQDLFNQGMGIANQFGQTQQMQIANAYQQALGQQKQSLTNAGLGNTTVLGSMNAGLLQNSLLNSTAAAEQTAQLQENVLGSLGSQYYGAGMHLGERALGAQQSLMQQYLGHLSQMGTTQQHGQESRTTMNMQDQPISVPRGPQDQMMAGPNHPEGSFFPTFQDIGAGLGDFQSALPRSMGGMGGMGGR